MKRFILTDTFINFGKWQIKFCLVAFLFLFFCTNIFGQATYTWKGPTLPNGSVGGSWATSTNWNPTRTTAASTDILQFNSGATLNITSVTSGQVIGRLIVSNNTQVAFNVTASTAITVGNGAGTDLVIDSGSKLTLASSVTRMRISLAANATGQIDGELILGNLGNLRINNTGCNILVNGKITNTGGSFSAVTATELTFAASSEMHHNRNGAALPLSTWDPNSTLRITGTTTTTSGGTAQTFGNVVLNSSGMGVNMTWSPIRIAGDLIIQNGTGGSLRQGSNYQVDGNVSLISGNYYISPTAARTLTIAGNYNQTGGTLDMGLSTFGSSLAVAGHFTHSAGTITESSSGVGTINLNGAGPIQTFLSGGIVSNQINWNISANSSIQTASDATTFNGGGNFTINSGATLGIRAVDGIATTGGTGHVRSTGTRNYNADANYIFNGTTNQTSNSNFPSSVNTIRIENTGLSGFNTVSWEKDVVVGADLLVNQGNLDLDTFTLNKSAAGGTFSLGAGLKLNVGGTDNFPKNYSTYTIPCTSIVEYDGNLGQLIGGVNYGVLIISGSDTKTFSSATSAICGNLTFTGTTTSIGSAGFSVGGNVSIDAGSNWTPGLYIYQVAGNWTRNGTFTASGSTFDFNGTGAAAISTSNFENVIFSGSGVKSASGPLAISGNVSIAGNFTAGALTHTVGGNWTKAGTFTATGSTINFTGTIHSYIGASNFNNLTFSGSGAKNAIGILTATGNISITNNFNAGAYFHTLAGNWTSSTGSYTPSTSTITFNGSAAQTITASSNTFYNLTLNNTAGLTAANGFSISNQLILDSGTLAAGSNLTMGAASTIRRRGTGTSTGMTGSIQGSNAYDVVYEVGTKSTGSEITGTGLRDVTLAMNASTTLTASAIVSLSQLLTIPTGNTLNMSTFQLTRPGLTTSGAGTLITSNTTINPLPAGVNWSFLVRYANLTGSQKVVFGTYSGLDLSGSSGVITLAQLSEGNITIGSGQFTLTGSQTYTVTGSNVVFNASAAQSIPAITFNNVTLNGSGDKTLSTLTNISGSLSIGGTAVAKLGNTNRTVGSLLLNNVIQSTGSYGSSASSATNKISQYFGTTGTGLINVTSVCIYGEWLGTTSTNWFDPTNWCGGLPTATTDVVISSSAPNQPSIGANGAIARSLLIQNGATLTVSGAFTINVEGNWTNAGTFISGASTVNFSGSNDALIGASNFQHITFSGSGIKSLNGAITVSGDLAILAAGNMDAGTFSHIISGNFSNSGSFDAENSTFLFNAGPSSISGSGAKNFYNLQVNGGVILTLSNATGVSNILTLTSGTLAAGTNLTMGANSSIQRAGTASLPTSFTGTLQGSNVYDVIYSGENKTSGAELSGVAGLRNLTLGLTSGNILTAGTNIAHTGTLAIPSGNTLAMGTFSLSNTSLITTGLGLLTTQNTGSTPLPAGKTWSFPVNYTASTGGQKLVFGTYNGLTASNSSGTNTLAPIGDGGEIVLSTGNFTALGAYTSTGSTVRFAANGPQSVPGIAFNNLILDGSGDKSFSGASNIVGSLTIIPGVIAKLGSINHSASFLTIGSTGQPNGTFGSSASGATFKINTSFGATGSGILTVASSNCTAGLWLGYVSSDWNDAANWCGSIPSSTTDVTISASAPNQPIIGSAGAIVRNITIQTDATLAFSGAFNLDIYGNWTNNGSYTPNQGRIIFKAVGNQTFGGTSSTSIYRVILEKASADQVILNSNLTLTNSLVLTAGTLTAGSRLTVVANTQITRGGITGATSTFSGTIQGVAAYDVIYQGNSKNTGAELSGTGLRNITLSVVADNEITATTNIAQTGQLAIPATMSLNMSTFTLSGMNVSSGTGLLNTANATVPPLPRRKTWTFGINYTASAGNQRIVYGIYNALSVLNTSGTTTLDPLSAGGEIEIASGNFTKSTGLVTGIGSRVNYSATANQSIPVISYGDLILQGSGDKTFGTATTIAGTITVNGLAIARLGSSVTHTAANLTLGSAGQSNGSYGSTVATTASFKVAQYFGTTGTGILNVTNSTCTPGVWLGYFSSNWNSASNWCGGVPNATTEVVIPAGTPFSPIISSGTNYNVYNITIETGAILEIQGTRSITVDDNWTNDGTFIPGSTSTVLFNNADEDQVISGSGTNSFYNLTINKANSTLSTDDPIAISGKLFLLDGDLVSNNKLTCITNSSIDRTDGTFAGTIQGSNVYDLTYLGGNKTTGDEVSGIGLRNMTLNLSGGNTITAGQSISLSGALTIPASQTLSMGSNALLSNTLTTTGTGTLSTSNTSTTPLPAGKTWAFGVIYGAGTGSQKVVHGSYNGLSVTNTSGTTSFAPQIEGTIQIVSGNLTLSGAGSKVASASQLRFSASAAQAIPALTYRNLELAGSGDKTLSGAVTVTEDFSVSGTAVAKLLNVNHTANTVTLGGATQPAGSYGSTASSAQFKLSQYFSSTGTGILTTATGNCVPGTWFGVTSSDWNTASNWCGGIPTLTTDVIIPSGTPFSPTIGVAGGKTQSIEVASGATLTSEGSAVLEVAGNWTINGTFNSGSTSIVEFKGPAISTINSGSFANVSFTGAGTKVATAGLTITGNVLITNNFTTGAFTHTVGGSWTNSGCLLATGSTIDFNGTNAANIAASNFQNVIFSGSGSKTAIGQLNIAGNVSISNNFTTGSFTHKIGGNLANSGTFSPAGSTIEFNGISGQQTFSGISTFNNLTVNNTNGLILPNAITVKDVLISAGSLNANNFNSTVNGNWTNNSGNNSLIGGTSTITFNGIAAQTIGGTFATNFNNLFIANSSSVSLANNTTINGNLSVSAGVFNLSTFTANRATAGGILTLSNNTTLRIGGTNSYPTNYTNNNLIVASTVEYSGTNQIVDNQLYGNLVLSSSGGAVIKILSSSPFTVGGNFTSNVGTGTSVTYTGSENITVIGNVSIGASTIFNGGNFSHTVGGDWVNNGLFNGNNSTIIYAGSGATVSGTGVQNFNNLTIAGSLVNFANANLTIAGNLLTTGSGSFNQATGGTVFMTGIGKTISGLGISLQNLTVGGSINVVQAMELSGNLLVSGSLTTGIGAFSMSGTSKAISGAGNISFGTLAIPGSVTTDANFSISSGLIVVGNLSASSGTTTFTGSSYLSGTANLFNATINGISLQLSVNSTLGVGNELTLLSGTLDATSSAPNTVNFNGSSTQNVNPLSYSNLILSNGSTKNASGNISTAQDITIAPSTTFNASSFIISIYGNWNNNGSFNGGTGTVQFLGPTNSYIRGATTFNILTSNTTSTTELILEDNISASTVNMIQGIISTDANTITITNTRSGNGYIYGNIQRNHTFTTGVAYAFEGPNNTITFSAVTGVTNITVSVKKGPIVDFPFRGSISREYSIAIPAGTYTASLRLHYEDQELNGNNEASIGLWKYNGSVWGTIGKTSNDVNANYVQQTGLTDLTNRWTLSDNSNVVRWNGSVSSDWNTAANWTVLQGSASRPPSASDIVNLGTASFLNQPIITNPVTVKNINFGDVQAVVLSLGSGGSLTSGDINGIGNNTISHRINVNNQQLDINGYLSLSDELDDTSIDLYIESGTVTINGALFQSSDAGIYFTDSGTLKILGDYNFQNGIFNAGSGTVIFNGLNNQNIASVIYNNLIVNKVSGSSTIVGNTEVLGKLQIAEGRLDNLFILKIAGDVEILPRGLFYNYNKLEIGGNWVNNGTFSAEVGQAFIKFNGSGTQTISSTTFNNLEIDKPVGSEAVLIGDIKINSDLKITSGTLDLGVFGSSRNTRGGTATLLDEATIVFGANNFSSSFANYVVSNASTVIINGSVEQALFLPGISIGNLILRNSGVKNLESSLQINGDLTIENGVTFNGKSNNITLNGNWIDEGTFNSSTSTVLFTGTSKNISGNTTFNKATITGSYTILANVTFNDLLNITSSGSLNGGSSILTTLNGDLFNSGVLYTLGTTTFTGNILQTLRLINATTTVALTVNFNGSVSPELISTSPPEFGYLNINNTSGVTPSVGWKILYLLTVGNGASFNGGISTHNVLGSVTNNGVITSNGVLNFTPSSAATLNLGSNFSSTGTVFFGGSGAISFVGNTGTFQNVIVFNTNGAGLTPSSGWNIGNDLSINSGSKLYAGSYIFTLGGDFTSTGILQSGTSTFTMDGGETQKIFTTSAFHNLSINKPSNSVTLLSDVSVNGVLKFVSGSMVTEDYHLIQPSSGVISGAAGNTGWVNGNLQKNVAVGSTVINFEVGDATSYTPISVLFESVNVSGDLIAKTIPADHPNLSSSTFRSDRTVNRYWSFINNGIEFTNASLTMNWVSSDVDAGANTDNLAVGNYDNNEWLYTPIQSPSLTSIQTTEVTSLKDVAVGESCTLSTEFSYSDTIFCSVAGTINPTIIGTAGIFSSETGLSLNPTTGVIDLDSSIPGNYTVINTASSEGGCTSTSSVAISIGATPDITLISTEACEGESSGTISVQVNSGVSPYTFSINGGPYQSDNVFVGLSAGNYSVKVKGFAGCEVSSAITVTAFAPAAIIEYAGNPYRIDQGNALVTLIGTPGGVYSSTTGLDLNRQTGNISLSSSALGTYLVTYTITSSANCAAFQTTTSITIDDSCGTDFTWLGINSNWFDPINWCGNQVPLRTGTTETIQIPFTSNQPIIEGANVFIDGEILLNADARLTIRSGNSFTLNPLSTVSAATGSLIIIEAGSIYRNLGLGVPFIQVNQLFTGAKGWRMVGSPLTTTYASMTAGFETQGFSGSTNPSLQPNLLWWDESDKGTTLQAWRQPANLSSPVSVGRGHYFYIFNGADKPTPATGNYTDVLPLTMSTTGTEVNLATGIFDFGLTFTARDTNLVAQADTLIEVNQADEGFNLIANPTASMLDWNAASGWSKTNTDESIYVWDPVSEAFLVWNGSIGTLGNGMIAPFQGFWVRANNASPSLQLTGNGAKSSTDKAFYGRTIAPEKPSVIHLQVNGENLQAESFISFGKDGLEGVDPKDAYQLESLAEDWVLLYTYGSLNKKTPLVINHLNPLDGNEKVIPLHLAASKSGNPINGNYLMNWTLPTDLPAEVSVTLMDHISHKAIDMRKESVHAFTFEAPKLPNARKGNSFNPLSIPQAVIFQSPYEAGEVNPNARITSGKIQRPFTIFISAKLEGEIGYLPDLPKLFGPVPNPFSTHTKISFYLPNAQKAAIQITDMLGQVVGSFPSEVYDAGIHELDWIPSAIELPHGMYIIRLTTDTNQVSQKLIKN
ncbi:T9SS type A sorting domain-containing protein [Algoriphagus ratkowskyi]|uniref:T9SS type A sorting domain-containing protein n=1 Tax=Algoriphagus ratkowskyi TaxID=57028 RepID=A0ABY3HJY1_9BACT|nr:T9SS type A sorting domain-containing protein [Algoriphagus ratkowskyi]TXD76293.1 T9SS type A sorting domain-containing protein [Algoriphagus ratkowskyi]